MKVSSVSVLNYTPKSVVKNFSSKNNINFEGKHTCRNAGIGIGSAVGLVGFGLWNLATGGVPLLIAALAAGGTAAAGAFGDTIDKIAEEEEKKKK